MEIACWARFSDHPISSSWKRTKPRRLQSRQRLWAPSKTHRLLVEGRGLSIKFLENSFDLLLWSVCGSPWSYSFGYSAADDDSDRGLGWTQSAFPPSNQWISYPTMSIWSRISWLWQRKLNSNDRLLSIESSWTPILSMRSELASALNIKQSRNIGQFFHRNILSRLRIEDPRALLNWSCRFLRCRKASSHKIRVLLKRLKKGCCNALAARNYHGCRKTVG